MLLLSRRLTSVRFWGQLFVHGYDYACFIGAVYYHVIISKYIST